MKIFSLVILSLILGGLCIFSCQTRPQPLQLVTLEYPPYEVEENGKITGMAVEIVEEVFQRMQKPVNIRLQPWDVALEMIKTGDADAVFTIFKTPAREQYADYNKEMLLPQMISLFTRKNAKIEYDGNLIKLQDYRFGIVKAVSYGSIIDSAFNQDIIRSVFIYETGQDNMEALLNGKIDILVSNRLGAWYILQQMGRADEVQELSPIVQSVPSYIAFSKVKDLNMIKDSFDNILKIMKEDGSYRKITDKYMLNKFRR